MAAGLALLQLLLAIVLADLGITLVHYASHRSALLGGCTRCTIACSACTVSTG